MSADTEDQAEFIKTTMSPSVALEDGDERRTYRLSEDAVTQLFRFVEHCQKISMEGWI